MGFFTKKIKNVFEEWIKNATEEELSDAYENERQKWMKEGFCNGTGAKTPLMKRLNDEISKRAAENWKKNPNRNPDLRWSDKNRWEKD